MKKILSIYDFLKELGGLERVMFFQANRLKKYADVELLFGYVSDKDKGKITGELELDKGVRISQIGRGRSEFFQLVLAFLFPGRIKKIRADLIISHSLMATHMAYLKKKFDGTPYIVIMYHPPNFLYSGVRGWINNPSRFFAKMLGMTIGSLIKRADIRNVREADLVMSISKYTAKRVKDIYGIKSEIVYPQISDFFKMMKEIERKNFLKEKKMERKFLLAHGRIIPDKNYHIILDIVKNIKDVDLIISGSISDSYKSELQDKIKALKLNDRVKILGRIPREDLLGYYNCAELLLVPAEKEDFGLTIVEAMACGCPVIAWDDGAGPSETVANGKSGLLAKPYSLKDFEAKIKEGLKRKWSRKNVAKTVNRFSEAEVGRKFISLVSRFLR